MNLRIVLASFLSLVLLFSCKKQTDNIFLSNEGTQGFDGYSFTDSLSLFTSTIREDSLETDNLTNNIVGAINDPKFGNSEAITYCQYKYLEQNKVISNQKLDSVVLYLQFTSKTAYYGNLNSNLKFKIYELTENMNSTNTHSNQFYSYSSLLLGSFNSKVNLEDSMRITESGKPAKVAPGISIKLNSYFAQKLLNAGYDQLNSQSNFTNFFKGLAIVPDLPGNGDEGNIIAFNLESSFSKLRLYYNDSMQSDFRVYDSAKRISRYIISNQPQVILNQKSAGVNSNFDSTFVQAMSGAKTRIQIPYLFSLIKNKSKRVAVGKAEIIIRPLAGSYSDPFSLPKRMLMLQPNPDTYLNAGIIDFVEPLYGGDFNSVSTEYRFNVTRHIQGLFKDYQLRGIDNNRGFYLIIPSDEPIAPSRIVVDARKKLQNSGIEFRIVYTEI